MLPANASFNTSQLSIFTLVSKIHFLEVFFSDIISDPFKHTLYIQNTSNLYWNTSNGLLPDSAAPFPSHWCAVQHCLHHNLSCYSHHLPRYCIHSNFLLSSIFSVSQFIHYLFSTTLLEYNIFIQQLTAFQVSYYLDSSFQVFQFSALWDCKIR